MQTDVVSWNLPREALPVATFMLHADTIAHTIKQDQQRALAAEAMLFLQARAARMARMQALKGELQRVETELSEAQEGHEEANEFGDDEMAAEFAAAESRLQVKCLCMTCESAFWAFCWQV